MGIAWLQGMLQNKEKKEGEEEREDAKRKTRGVKQAKQDI